MTHLYDWYGWNLRLFHLINGVHGTTWDVLMRWTSRATDHRQFVAYLAAVCLLASIAVARGLVDGRGEAVAFRWFSVVWVLTLGYVLDQAVVTVLKEWFSLPRPDAILPAGDRILIGRPRFNGSFPSGHVIFATLLATSLWPLASTAVRWLLALGVVAVCVSRISLGMHFPADVVGAVLVGATIPLLLRRALQALWRYALPSESEMP